MRDLRARLDKLKKTSMHYTKKNFSMSDLAMALAGHDDDTKREYRLQLINEAIFDRGRREPILSIAQNGFSNPTAGEPPADIKKQIRHVLYKAGFDKELVKTWFN